MADLVREIKPIKLNVMESAGKRFKLMLTNLIN